LDTASRRRDAAPLPNPQPNALIAALGALVRAHPLERKILVCSSMGAARETLRALARGGCGWVALDPSTPKALAHRLIAAELADVGLALADDLAERAALDTALDEALAGADPRFQVAARGLGFRGALAGSVSALRLAGATPSALQDVDFEDPGRGALLLAALAAYEAALAGQRLVDAAGTLARAAARLAEGTVRLPGRVLLTSGLSCTGVGGAFVRALRKSGAELLPADPVAGLPAPAGRLWHAPATPGSALGWLHQLEELPRDATPVELDFFHAASPGDELREVLRRALARGLHWDEVEIVATDAAAYGSALDGIARRLGASVTYAVGLPIERTRAGRAFAGYLRWIEEGYPADAIRALLEAGDIGAGHAPGERLARRLRLLRIGWGLDRYAPALTAVAAGDEDGVALRDLLMPIIESAPAAAETELSAGRLARGALVFLACVPVQRAEMEAESSAHRLLTERLERVVATLHRVCTRSAALATLRTWTQIRVPPPAADGRAPWGSAGGGLHLTDVEHAGFSGRRATFVVGLDDAALGGSGQDPLLPDSDRQRIVAALKLDGLPTSAQQIEERRHRLAAALARLRGSVTLSHAAWDATDGRTLAPSPVLLQALRLARRDDTVDYAELARTLGTVASAVPRGGAILDSADAWLGALASRTGLRHAPASVAAGFPRLGDGVRARTELATQRPGVRHGLLGPRAGLDPRNDPTRFVSATGLEALGSCGLRYFFRAVLRLRPPDDPAFEPDAWLDPLARGRLLHAVFEDTLRAAREQGYAPEAPAFDALAERTLEQAAAALRSEIPAPSDAVYARELELLRADVASFCMLVRERGGRWRALELAFGPDTGQVAECALPSGGRLGLTGRIDRIDEGAAGLVVIDYKTGGFRGHDRIDPFEGGRRLQHVVYAEAAARLLNERVEAVEYHYPTQRGQNEVFRYETEELREGLSLLDRLLDRVRDGQFLPTDDPEDCRFCDYRGICRARDGRPAPLVAWVQEHGESCPEYATIAVLRGGRRS
jgi:RecB family exonuclease